MSEADSKPILAGVAYMCAATVLFAVSNAIVKWEVAIYPTGEVLFWRSLGTFLAVGCCILPAHGLAAYRTDKPLSHVARGASQAISQGLTVLALGLLPLAGATAFSFSAPLWAALISCVFLSERLTAARSAALVAGFAGVLLVAQPGSGLPTLGAIFALGNAVMYGSVTVAVRGMARTETATGLLIWQASLLAVAHAALLPLGFAWPSAVDFVLLAICGLANAGAQYCWTQALVKAPTAAVAPFYYLLLIWSVLIGFAVWGDIPAKGVFGGVALIAVASLGLIWQERRAGGSGRGGSGDPVGNPGERKGAVAR